MRKLHLVYFSPNHTTEKVIHASNQKLQFEVVSHNFTTSFQAFTPDIDDIVFIASPVYSGRVPDLFNQRLAGIKGQHNLSIVFVVYGNRAYDDALLELKTLAERQKLKVVGAIAAIGQHSLVLNVAKNRPNQTDLEQIADLSFDIINNLYNFKLNNQLHIPGKKVHSKAKRLSLTPYANDNCVHCNKCVEACPSHAIDQDHFIHPNPKLCIGCLACVNVCQHNSRTLSKAKAIPISFAIELASLKPKNIESFKL